MPELPEVETTVRDLQKKVLKRTFVDVWTDSEKIIQKPSSFKIFRKQIKGKKILNIWRRGKNILFELSGNKVLLVHQKLTGHLLLGHWILDNGCWKPKIKGPLGEKINTYIRLLFALDNGEQLALSDLRKFAKIQLWGKKEWEKSEEFKNLGPEPLERNFTFQKFKEYLKGRKKKIKQVLMDQSVIAGIGNIYSDEILWEAKINPLKETGELSDGELKRTYKAIKKVLKEAIELKGESISDFRRISGERGFYDEKRKVYRKEGQKCPRCGTIIKRKKIVGRSAHFCPSCQK